MTENWEGLSDGYSEPDDDDVSKLLRCARRDIRTAKRALAQGRNVSLDDLKRELSRKERREP